jgi:predicted AAA+ superfamily ATPase
MDISLPPFSFREWLRFHHREYADIARELIDLQIDISDKGGVAGLVSFIAGRLGEQNTARLNELVGDYAKDGGFPQLWGMSDFVERVQFIDLQFVQRVTLEDLRLVREIRRPEIFHQILRYVFARTGEEYNLEELAGKIKTTRTTLSEALPLLLQTELIRKVERFANKPVRLRSTHAKLYAADTVLYEAITKMPADLKGENKGRLAETLAFNVLRRFAGIADICYFRTPDGKREVDFILRIGKTLIPVEIKSGAAFGKDNSHMSYFLEEYGSDKSFGIMVCNGDADSGENILNIPLGVFLLLC